MNPSSPFDADGQSGLQALWDDGECVFCRGWRLGPDGQRAAVLALLPASEHPSPACLDRLAHEYDLKDELDGAWAVRPLELARDRDRTVLVLEDPGGEPLERLLGPPMEMPRFLRLAIGSATALGKAHQRGLVHKELKPAHILVNCADGQARLTGFGIASRLARERQAPEPPEFIAGTLAYMAPEQTGRMNRSIDCRSDLYALGVTLYQMLTGVLPFTASDPMDWVHCHIARMPAPPSDRLENIPVPVSQIVMRLLAKTAEERYQTAAGLESDLRRCLAEWEAHRSVDEFTLGQNDIPDRLLIPEKLYGRAREVEILLAAFDRVVACGGPELVLVSGYSGVGKSSVVNEMHKALVRTRGLFASGKFDQYKRDIPYATLTQAFQSLIRRLLGKSDAELARWRDALLDALGPNARLVVDLIPELKLIIGEQPPVPELEPQQAQSRFQLVLRRFTGVFARPEHPLALFLDDLQWLDGATLDLLEDLLTRSDRQHLMLIGAYRDNEVDAAHPLMSRLRAISKKGVAIDEITLAPLGRKHIEKLVADALHCDSERAAPLARLVHGKTAGNPFFVIQFLYALEEAALLRFDHDTARWCWDLDRIHDEGYTDNVVDLMVGKLNRLPARTQQALQQLACLGNVAETGMLSIVLGVPEPQVHAALWPAVRQDLVERLAGSCKFVHDRVHEAAYSLIPEASRAEVHLRVGRLLVAQTPPEKREEAIFDIVSQLNRGAAMIAAREERDQLAELNLIAGKRAKGSTAYTAALAYLNAGAGLLAKDGWERRRELTFALELNRAECEFLTGGLAAAEERLNVLATRVATTIERAAVVCLLLDLYTTSGQSSRGVAVGLEYLRHLGVEWSPHPSDEDVRREYARFWSQLGSRTIEDLIELPLMSDPASLATMDVLTNIPSAFLREKNLYALAMCWAVNLSLERGNSDGSCATYVQFGCVIGMHFGDYESAYRFGRLGCALVERHGLNRFQARTYLAAGCHLIPYAKHVRIARDLLSRGFEIANKSGDLMYMGWYRGFYLIENHLSAGDPLTEVQHEAELGLAFAQKMQLGHVMDVIPSFLGLVRMLRGLTSKFGSFTDEQVNELRIEARLAGNPDFALAECLYYLRKLQAHFHAGDYAAAIQAASRAEKLHPPALLWMFTAADYRFYSALSQAGCCDSGPADERQQHLLALAAHHRQLQAWAQNCPENFENRAALVGAEMARLEGRAIDAELLYERAIRSSRANGFIQNEALAYELASRFYGARGFEKIARVYLQDASYCYLRWGADGKVRQLEEIYPHLRSQASAPSSSGTIATSVEHLDLATVIKVSQAISGEIVLENLINMLMRTAIEQAGAERGLLILPRGGEQRMAAEAVTGGDTIHVQPRDLPVTATLLPESVLHYVVRTRESVILDDAATQPSFAADPYIRQHHARSILCLPLLNQAKLSGVLYLENNLAPRVFAPARIAVLKVLASQAAIALENAGLYRDLAEREAKIRRLVDANIVGIFSWDMEGLILEANDAFLRMVGYTREDVVSGRLRWTELTPPEWREIDEQQLFPAMRMTGHLPPFEKEYFRKDGSRVPVLIGVATFEQGQSQGVAFALDLTERKRGEKALRAREAQIRRLVDANIIGVYVADLDGRILEANDAFLRIVGYRREDLSSGRMHVMDMTPPEWRDRTGRTMAEIKLGKTVQPYEKEYFRADGSRVPVLVGSTPFEESNLGVALGVVFVIDLTERKQVEAAARESEQRYREVEMELAHANRVATMGQLTASIAHEVNQPIAATVTNAQAALRWLDARTPDLEEARQALARIVKDGNRAGDVVSRIRGLVSKTPPRKDRLRINGAIREVIELTRVEAMRKGVSVQLELAEGLPTIEGDRVGLQQVMLNLIINAVEAMSGVPEGPRDLLVTSGTAGADRVLVAVRDSGPGLTPTAFERLFDAFYTTKPTGLGLGLSICHSIIEAHDGRLWASANEPRGAIFQFTVPAHPGVATESARAG